jgi:biopolymer transport protein ExbD
MRPSRPRRRFRMRDTMLLSGWLFADLLLALFVIFLSANTVGVKPQPIPTQIPTVAVVPTPTPQPLLRLELNKHHLQLSIDSAGLLNNAPNALHQLEQEVRAQAFLQGRVVGLVIAYGNAADPSQIQTAQTVAQKVMNALQTLGRQNFAFTRTSYYDPLYSLYSNPNFTEIDLYLFAQ